MKTILVAVDFSPVTTAVIEHATLDQVAAVLVRKLELPEVFVQQVPTRSYPESGLGAHLFGYVSEIRMQVGPGFVPGERFDVTDLAAAIDAGQVMLPERDLLYVNAYGPTAKSP